MPVAVNAVEWNPAGSWYKHGASVLVCIECEGGIRATYRGSWCSEGANTSWECSWRAVCTQGSALWDGREAITVETIDPTSSGLVRKAVALEPSPAVTLPLQGHAGCIDDMLNAIKEGRTPMTVGTDNIFSLAIVQAAIKSAENGGRRVSIDEI
jgi:predicted dehydrogenase